MAQKNRGKGTNGILPAFVAVVIILMLPILIGLLSQPANLFGKAQVLPSFTFTAAGDFGGGSNATAVFNTIKNSGSELTIAVGDMGYSTSPQTWGDRVRSVLGNDYPFEFIAGNHDDDQISQYITAVPNKLGNVVGEYGKEYYFDYPSSSPLARFILVSPDLVYGYPYSVGDSHYNWVADSIDQARAVGIPWIVVGMHKNCITMGEKSCEIGSALMNLLLSKKVDLVLQGHDHNYQRSKQLSCATVGSYNSSCVINATNSLTKGEGTVFVIVGTGGQGLYGVNTGDSESGYFASWTDSAWGISKFVVTQDRIDGQFVRTSGGAFADSFSISANGALPTPTPDVNITPTSILTPAPTSVISGAPVMITKRVSAGSDDAEQNESGGSVSLGSSDLEFTMDGSTKQIIGMRFTGLNIPQGAVIQSAYIELIADEAHSEATSLIVRGQLVDNATTFTTLSSNLSSRAKTNASVSWSSLPAWTVGSVHKTPDLSAVVQEIVNQSGWTSGNAMAFFATGTGHRTAEAYESGSSLSSKLVVTYVSSGSTQPTSTPSTPTPTAVMPTPTFIPTPTPALSTPTPVPTGGGGSSQTFSKRVASGNDDAEERGSSGSMDLSSSDLEFVMDGSTKQVVGMRFTGVSVPRGATITDAYLEFTADEAQSEATSLSIYAHAADSSASFTTSAFNISSRAKTSSSVLWSNLSSWAVGAKHLTPNLSSVVSEIINRPGWVSGNAMTFIVTGTGHRTAEAYNGSSSLAPRLVIVYR